MEKKRQANKAGGGALQRSGDGALEKLREGVRRVADWALFAQFNREREAPEKPVRQHRGKLLRVIEDFRRMQVTWGHNAN